MYITVLQYNPVQKYNISLIIDMFHKILESRIKENKSRLLYQKKNGWSWKQITWLDFDSEVRSIASYLLDAGFKQGDRVLIISPNSIECTFTECAVLLLGGTCIPLSADESADNVRSVLDEGNVRYIFLYDQNTVDTIRPVIDNVADGPKIFSFSDLKDPGSMVVNYKTVIKFGYMKRKKLNDAIDRIAAATNGETSAFEIYCFNGRTNPRTITHEVLIKLLDVSSRKLRFVSREDQSFSLLYNRNTFSRLVNLLPVYICNRGAMASNEKDFLTDVKEIMPTILFISAANLQSIYTTVMTDTEDGKVFRKCLGGRVKYIFTDTNPGFSIRSSLLSSGISVIELAELANFDC